MDITELHRRTVEAFVDRVRAVPDGSWEWSTPCGEWNVHDLVNHVVGEQRWVLPLMDGQTIADVGSSLDGDLLGDRPAETAAAAAADAISRVNSRVPEGGKVHLSYGEEDVEEYVRQLSADHLIHAWDLAAATGGDTNFDEAVVGVVAEWFRDREDLYRSAGIIGPRVEVANVTIMESLLAASGRNPTWHPPT